MVASLIEGLMQEFLKALWQGEVIRVMSDE
jgi:hypothetical protein